MAVVADGAEGAVNAVAHDGDRYWASLLFPNLRLLMTSQRTQH